MMRPNSPAMSEISVGSPSPPPVPLSSLHALHMKRLRPSGSAVINSPTSAHGNFPARRKSTIERVKSFSIADILGKKEEHPETPSSKPISRSLSPALVSRSDIPQATFLPVQLIAERLQPPSGSSPLATLDLPGVHKVVPTPWDHTVLPNHPNAHSPLTLHPFLSPALLHYEQRLAWDYQRQLQEHFQAQAQLLRQMSMDPNIIPSEDGSERSRSSSPGSHCCSPEVNVAGDENDEADSVNRKESFDKSEKCDKTVKDSDAKKRNKNSNTPNDTPLDALFQLSTKNFDEDQDPATLSIFAARPNPKKKRKSRTAFTNHQIFELEKRFLYQKYLSPADRDEIAAGLGLSNAQVITWFQNRRAKLKRDMEELKKDVESVKQLSAHKSFLENVNDLSILKTRPVSRYHHDRHQQHQQQQQPQQQHQLTEVHGTATTAAIVAHGHVSLYTQAVHPVRLSQRRHQEHKQQQQQHPRNQRPTADTCSEDKKPNNANEGSSSNDNNLSRASEAESPPPSPSPRPPPPTSSRNRPQINSSRG